MSGKSQQLPSNLVAQEFGEVNVRYVGDKTEVLFTVLMEPTGKDAEGWRTGIALDASISMKWAYGKKLDGKIPADLKAEYEQKGWTLAKKADGVAVRYLSKEAQSDAIAKGHLKYSENVMQNLARDFVEYLASNLDSQGKTHIVYWACGDGGEYEAQGDIAGEMCQELVLEGPKGVAFGKRTQLRPVLQYFDEYFSKARQTMAIFLTDG